jgi:hypothetical protein
MWGRLSSLRSAFQPAWLPFTHCPLLTQSYPAVEQAARLAMPAVTPAEEHNPERYGSSNAIHRQDWRRGPQECALHLKPPFPPVGQAF